MRITIVSILAAVGVLACKGEPARDADPCAKASANARRLAAAEPTAAAQFGAQPLTLERCRTLTREEVQCAGYASSWSELSGCGGGVLSAGPDGR